MKPKHLITLLTILIFVTNCKDNKSVEQMTQTEEVSSAEKVSNKNADIIPAETTEKVYAWVDLLRLRKLPSPKAEVLLKIPEGDSLIFTGEETLEKMRISLRGKTFNEPWIKVKTFSGIIGWVYKGGITQSPPLIDRSPLPFDECYYFKGRRYQRAEQCMKKIAGQQLKADARFVTKRSDALIFNLFNGDFKVIESNKSRGKNYKVYSYCYYLKKMGFFVVRIDLTEGHEYLLIDDKTGDEYQIYGFPKPSPNGKYLVATNADLYEEVNFNGIEIWGFTNDGFHLMWKEESREAEPFWPKWFNNKTIQVYWQVPAYKPGYPRKADDVDVATIELAEEGKWEMRSME